MGLSVEKSGESSFSHQLISVLPGNREDHDLEELDQGTILFGLRSNKYPGIPCYGIIITASCDISNDKVAKLYYLIGIDAKRWFCTEYAYHQIYGSKIKTLFNQVKEQCERFHLDADAIRSFAPEDVQIVIKDVLTQKTDQDKFEKAYQPYATYFRPGMDDEARRLVSQRDTKPVLAFLKDIGEERRFHFFFLPKATYLADSGLMNDGLIVDLQEIGAISMYDAKQIIGRGIDSLLLVGESAKERDRLCTQFWLEGQDDFVGIEGKITSPWREHLMQRFVRDFSRIGLNGANEQDYRTLVQNI